MPAPSGIKTIVDSLSQAKKICNSLAQLIHKVADIDGECPKAAEIERHVAIVKWPGGSSLSLAVGNHRARFFCVQRSCIGRGHWRTNHQEKLVSAITSKESHQKFAKRVGPGLQDAVKQSDTLKKCLNTGVAILQDISPNLNLEWPIDINRFNVEPEIKVIIDSQLKVEFIYDEDKDGFWFSDYTWGTNTGRRFILSECVAAFLDRLSFAAAATNIIPKDKS